MPLRVQLGTLTMGSLSTTSGTMIVGVATSGVLMMPDEFTGTTLNFVVSPNGVDYRLLLNSSGTIVPAASALGSRVYPIPTEVLGAHSFYLQSGSQQAQARNFVVRLMGGG